MDETHASLARLRAFWFPGGEDAARAISAVRTTERGEMRTSPGARWVRFTAEQVIDAKESSFCWEARYQGGSMAFISITDAYERGHGRLAAKVGGVIPLKKAAGPEVDKGELQRYLASIPLCPPIVLSHTSLEWNSLGPLTLRVRDRADVTGATLDLEMREDGSPRICRAERPRLVGRRMILTPWSGECDQFREQVGMRLATQLQVAWHLAEGKFTYYRSEVVSFTVVR